MGNPRSRPVTATKPLNPTFVPRNPPSATPLWRSALVDPTRVFVLDPNATVPRPVAPLLLDPPVARSVVSVNRARFLGPTYAALTQAYGNDPTLDDMLRAEAVLGIVPALLLASAARPITDRVRQVIGRIPPSVRRPFEKLFGVLIDSGLAYASGAAQSLFDRAVRDYAPGAALPPRVELPVTAISQLDTSCGETAVAMILKAAGEPVLVAEIDTQVQGPYGIPGLGGISGFAGNSIAVDREFARRGLSAISGPSDLGRLKQFVASGMPVMVSVGWSNGAGHLAVVSGYNEATGTLSICNWVGDGTVRTVAATEFDTAWARHMRYMTAVGRQRDPRLEKLLKATDLRRDSGVAQGFSITDFWCDAKRLLVEAAYRYVTPRTEVTVKVSFNSDGLRNEDPAAMRWLNGSIAVRQRVADGWYVGFRVEKLSLRKESGEWQTLRTLPVGAALSLEGPAFALTVAAERGAVQASLAASLGRAVADLGFRVNVSVNAEGACTVQGVLSGTW